MGIDVEFGRIGASSNTSQSTNILITEVATRRNNGLTIMRAVRFVDFTLVIAFSFEPNFSIENDYQLQQPLQ